MGCLLISILVDQIAGASRVRLTAVGAFESPPISPAPRRYRIAALCLLLASSGSLAIAALVDTIAGARSLSDVFGWSGIVGLEACVLCGLRYAAVNEKPKKSDDWDLE
jgi:hypothetical protein